MSMSIDEAMERIKNLSADSDKHGHQMFGRLRALVSGSDLSTLLAQAKRDAEIVGRLPRTRDGVPIVPPMKLYCPFGHEMTYGAWGQKFIECRHDDCYDDYPGDKHFVKYPIGKCYSTREAALAALSPSSPAAEDEPENKESR